MLNLLWQFANQPLMVALIGWVLQTFSLQIISRIDVRFEIHLSSPICKHQRLQK